MAPRQRVSAPDWGERFTSDRRFCPQVNPLKYQKLLRLNGKQNESADMYIPFRNE